MCACLCICVCVSVCETSVSVLAVYLQISFFTCMCQARHEASKFLGLFPVSASTLPQEPWDDRTFTSLRASTEVLMLKQPML